MSIQSQRRRFLPPMKSNDKQHQKQRSHQQSKTDDTPVVGNADNENVKGKAERTADQKELCTMDKPDIAKRAKVMNKRDHRSGKVKVAMLYNSTVENREACSSGGCLSLKENTSLCLDKSLEARRAHTSVYEFRASPPPTNEGKPDVATAAMAEVELVILKGHHEFMALLERRRKLREIMDARGICYREPCRGTNYECNEYDDIEPLLWFDCDDRQFPRADTDSLVGGIKLH